ncbi:MAG: cyanophycinase [Planctomycetes bacterium]|nr:cyanophycinase [Planctomycetota bacterium]
MSVRILGVVLVFATTQLAAQTPATAPATPGATPTSHNAATSGPQVDPAGVVGTRLLGGGGRLPARVYERFLELAGGKERARIVLIPTASETVDDPAGLQKALARWQQDHPGFQFELLHTRDRQQADDEAFCAPLRTATAVWLGGGAQKNLADAYLGTRVERELQALLARGGVVGGTSAGTAIQTRTMIQEGRENPIVATGFDFVPFAVSDQHFLKRSRLPRLVRVLGDHPGHFGIGVDEGTAVLLQGRTLEVLGDSKAVLVLPAAAGRPQRVLELAEGEREDLVAWQRAARERAGAPWPATPMAEPKLQNGTLLLAGGGPLPNGLVDRFVELAGGANAKIVVVGGATEPGSDDHEPFATLLQQRGLAAVATLALRHPRDVDEAALAALRSATGVWFGGGRQWRFVDTYEGTPAVAAFHAVLARGGVIAGSSAGATIQGEFLVRGSPLGNTVMRCEGYERGFGFLPGCAIDQHFVARDRERDMVALIGQLPQLIGLGIDEGAAIEVRGSLATVLGERTVAVFDARRPQPDRPTMHWLSPGESWDLVAGARVAQAPPSGR